MKIRILLYDNNDYFTGSIHLIYDIYYVDIMIIVPVKKVNIKLTI